MDITKDSGEETIDCVSATEGYSWKQRIQSFIILSRTQFLPHDSKFGDQGIPIDPISHPFSHPLLSRLMSH